MLILKIEDVQCNRQKRATGAVPHSLQENVHAQLLRTDMLGNNTHRMINVLEMQTEQITSMLNHSAQMVSLMATQKEQVKNLTHVVESMAALTAVVESMAALFPVLIKGLRLTAGDCSDIAAQGPYSSGVYTITPWDDLGNKGSFKVYCDMKADNAGWTVFQKRINGSVDFYRDWNEYKNGFGDLDGEFWLGLDRLNRLTSTRVSWQLKVELEDFEGNTAYAMYDDFHIGDESTQFQLSIGSYSGTAGDSLTYHAGMKFSTKDSNNDVSSGGTCATSHKGAWWYNRCHSSNLNGPYLESAQSTSNAITWYYWKTRHIALKKAEMKIRPTI